MMPNEMQEFLAKILFFIFAITMLTFAKVQANENLPSHKSQAKQVRFLF